MSDVPSPAPARYFAPAKVNFGLSVLGLRADGYHELHSVMVPLSVGDELDIEPAADLTLSVVGADLPTDERNLVYRAARAYLDAAGRPGGARITLHKALPLASGLGGGSSDAATTLLALARLYPARVDLPALALRLGADVPFFLLGRAALAEGVGERLLPVPMPCTHMVLVNPGVEVSARDAYRWLDAEEAFTGPLDLEGLAGALTTGRAVPYVNALQGPVVARHAPIAAALATLAGTAGLHSPLMSGSGSTCFALARTAEAAHAAAAQVRAAHPAWWVRAAHTL
ncbi:4-(cytidine 5'-diphospho)-2-C-methyl-D-erythritol kinase [Deinococcus maricopensis]|uniref:4-diphosphocytidyl-2-C-methyl-D-erythritol kinase n=1 Tax=Deinococcus maricopensis (strain DSM 21211 / LMG 22137 / NRRL B-23946 / LB-34) TaxID=709986 RepID=E8U6L2_DEIML|nr:4-(cytidine 5'-diphospho)-2-C-methyl-D-erythritol kinase [Deinococcus maricopensis]ADV66701.1 4-diphosphocytidyl-2-C-methyl-D-erythritolkinase [Deinococcus maricopensis DSM 21211]